MKIALVQPKVGFDLEESLASVLEGLKKAVLLQADIAVLPELWNTPFINSEIQKHDEDGPRLLKILQEFCAENRIWLVSGTFNWKDEGGVKNRCFVISNDGEVMAKADKLHLLEVHTKRHSYLESEVFAPGNSLCRFATPWGMAGLCVCFDIRFPELARLLCEKSRFLFVPAGFNEMVGRKHWKHLLCARAIENEVFVIGVNPQAADYGSYHSYGHSLLVCPDGEILCEMEPDEFCRVVEIDPEEVDKIRGRSPFWRLRRPDLYDLEALKDDSGSFQDGKEKDGNED